MTNIFLNLAVLQYMYIIDILLIRDLAILEFLENFGSPYVDMAVQQSRRWIPGWTSRKAGHYAI
jgi:hypothetical protein